MKQRSIQDFEWPGPGRANSWQGGSFLRDGGMIAFVIENRRVRFDINQTAAESAALKLSSRLFERSEIYREIESGTAGLAMRTFRNIPIGQKLVIIIMVTTTAALLLAGCGIVLTDSLLFRGYLRRDLSALAQIIADNSTAALAFNDPKSAAETLGALRARSHVVGACIYRLDGNILASYSRQAHPDVCRPIIARMTFDSPARA